MPTDTARHYAEKVRDTLKAIAEADERNLDLLTNKEFDAAEHKVAAREARGLRAALLLHAANLAEAVLAEAESPTEPRYSMREVDAAVPDVLNPTHADGEAVLERLTSMRKDTAPTPNTRCPAEFAGHVCGLMRGHETSTKHWDSLTDMEWS